MSTINAMRIREILGKCFFSEVPEIGTEAIKAKGINNTFILDPKKITEFESEIISMLDELNEDIREDKGGGISLICIPFDKHDHQWGEQINANELMVLGMAIGRIKYLFENRMIWSALPGSVPYYVYTTEKFEPEKIKFDQDLINKMIGRK